MYFSGFFHVSISLSYKNLFFLHNIVVKRYKKKQMP